jgi:Flp pilus assembly pilin Flp
MNSRVNNSQAAPCGATYPRGRSLGIIDILLRAQVRVQTTLFSLRPRQEGQGLVEYGLIIASIAILLIVAMLFLAGRIDDLFSETGSSVDSPGPLP